MDTYYPHEVNVCTFDYAMSSHSSGRICFRFQLNKGNDDSIRIQLISVLSPLVTREMMRGWHMPCLLPLSAHIACGLRLANVAVALSA